MKLGKISETDRLILQTFSPGFGGPKVPEWIKPWLENGLGSITLFASNTPNIESATRIVAEIKSYNPDVLISIDEEGGDVTRLFVREGSKFPSPALLGQCDDEALTYSSFNSMGNILKKTGIDMTFAPVADVVSFDSNAIIGVRSFGKSTNKVARHVKLAIKGLQDAGVLACVKHFPGHGAVLEDSHHDLPTVKMGFDEYLTNHIQPFKDAIAADVAAIMVGHIVIKHFDHDNPASLSRIIIQDYLRRELNFNGLVITDALDMGALGGPGNIDISALRALQAGVDLLCFSGLGDQSSFVANSFERIRIAIDENRLSVDSLELSAKRLQQWQKPKLNMSSQVKSFAINDLIAGFEISGDVLLKSPNVNLVEIGTIPTVAAGDVSWGIHRELRSHGIKCDIQASDAEKLGNKKLVVAFRDAYRDKALMATLNKLNNRFPDAIFIDMGWPSRQFKPTNLIRTFGSSAVIAQAVAIQMQSTGKG